MCGVLGVFNFNKKIDLSKNIFLNALELLKHRGPDSSGVFAENNYLLGHTRLSIIDLSRYGNQPMHSNNKRFCISFNGEIYNYLELKDELISKGIKFKSNTDTEVLLEGLAYFGEKFIEKCNGMFAFIFLDKVKKEVLIVRDRLGIKPIYYTILKKTLYVSSEIRPIIKLKKELKEISKQSLYSYFAYRQPLEYNTYFKNILSLEPGTYLKFSKDKLIKKKYYHLSSNTNSNKKNFKNNLVDSVSLMLRSDVKISNLLSGGIDSTVIAYLSSIKEKITSYSIGDKADLYNEFYYSRYVSNYLNINNREVFYNYRDYLKYLDELIEIKYQPITIPNEILQYQLCKEIKKNNSSVVLSGCGADEILLGYDKIFSMSLLYDKLLKKKLNTNTFFDPKKKGIIRLIHDQYAYTNYDIRKNIFSSDFDILSYEKKINKFFNKFFNLNNDYTKQLQTFFLKFHLKGILEREDISSMAASVELRVPYLDHNVVESALNLKTNEKLDFKNLSINFNKNSMSNIDRYVNSKKILKKIYRNKIPKEIISRPKIGFPVNLNQIIFEKKNKEEIYYTINSRKVKNENIFDQNQINKLFDCKPTQIDPRNYQKSLSGLIFMVYNISKFISKV